MRKQDGQCTSNVTLRCVGSTTVVVEKQWLFQNLWVHL